MLKCSSVKLTWAQGPRSVDFAEATRGFPYPHVHVLKLDGKVDDFAIGSDYYRHKIRGLEEVRKIAPVLRAATEVLDGGGEASIPLAGNLWPGEKTRGTYVFTQPGIHSQTITLDRKGNLFIRTPYDNHTVHEIQAHGPRLGLVSESVRNINVPQDWAIKKYGFR